MITSLQLWPGQSVRWLYRYTLLALLMLTSLRQLAMRSLLITALIYVFYVNVISSNAVFTNVAYSKPVTLSSEHGFFPGKNAVNGLLSDFTHTGTEKLPWLRIDLGAQHIVHEIEVFARSDCCGKYSHSLWAELLTKTNMLKCSQISLFVIKLL